MTEQQMMYRDITLLRQNINRELDDLANQVVFGRETSLRYSKNYILSEIESFFDAYITEKG